MPLDSPRMAGEKLMRAEFSTRMSRRAGPVVVMGRVDCLSRRSRCADEFAVEVDVGVVVEFVEGEIAGDGGGELVAVEDVAVGLVELLHRFGSVGVRWVWGGWSRVGWIR